MASPSPLDATLNSALQAGIARSERLRVQLFLGILTVVLALALHFHFLAPLGLIARGLSRELVTRLSEGAPRIAITVAVMIVYEALVLLWLRRDKGERPLGTVFLWVHTAIEASLVTVLLALAMKPLGVVQVLAAALPLLYFPVIILSALNLNFRLSAWSGLVAAFGFLGLVLFSLQTVPPVSGLPMLTSPHQYIMKAFVLILSGLTSGLVAHSLRRQLVETLQRGRERDRAVSIFGQHVSPQVAERLLNQPWENLGEERNVCVMFLDIRDFSVFAGEKSAPEVMQYLNVLFGGLIECVNNHRGIVNKFLGDGFMAVFGAPADDEDRCTNAVRCGYALLEEIERMNTAGKIELTRLGIGLHVGPAVTGNVGSEQRKEYTIIGDTVNLASRIEQATKSFRCSFLISDAVWHALPPKMFQGEDMGELELKGQAKPTRLFKLA